MTDTQKPTALEVSESLSGFDEEAIERAFGKEYDDLNGRNTLRALIFTMRRREGLDDAKAKKAAMEVPMGQLTDHFAAASQELDETDPETEAGKESSSPA